MKKGGKGAPQKGPQKGAKKAPAKSAPIKSAKPTKHTTTGRKQKVAPAPILHPKKQVTKKQPQKKVKNPLFIQRPRNLGIGNEVPPRRDLTRFVKWPRYIRLQRQEKVLKERLKIPPTIHQFSNTLDRQTASHLFRLAKKYQPESRHDKRQRLLKRAQERVAGKPDKPTKRPFMVASGMNTVTCLIERKKAQLVAIAHDVEPIDLVMYMPALCRKMDVPYCIVKGKARLGRLVRRKTCTCVAITDVNNEDKSNLAKVIEAVRCNYNDRFDDIRRQWGGGLLGRKAMKKKKRLEKLRANEEKKKAQAHAT